MNPSIAPLDLNRITAGGSYNFRAPKRRMASSTFCFGYACHLETVNHPEYFGRRTKHRGFDRGNVSEA